ncbi:MAG TPA: cytochrome b [Thermohalobaculum sp.]|nr:cytochrome b [Thermohalobaculum sp.]
MGLGNTPTGWGWPARLLHWLMAALILFQIGLGLWMVNAVADPVAQFALYQTHKSWGFVIFALALVRVAWRLSHPAPDLPPGMGRREAALARGAHLALYALMIALPLSGWLMVSASTLQESFGIRNMVFGLFELPDPFQPGSKALEDLLRSVHTWSAVALTLILAGHVGAALRHHFGRRDAVLRRMILGR